MKRIRVMQLGSPTGLYGAERWILALIKHLDRNRIESMVSAIEDDPRLDAAICREAENAGFRSIAFKAYGRVNFSSVKSVRDYVSRNGVDVLHTHGYKADITGLLATAGTKCRIISTPHGWSKNNGIKLQIYELLDRMIFPFFDAVTPLSPELYSELQKIPLLNSKLRLILNGVDISEVDSVTNVSPEILALKSEGIAVVGYIGQLIHRKGLDILMQAFKQLDISKKRLCIVGDGPLQADLELLARKLGILDQTIFFGFKDDRIAFLKGFDVFVLPSRLEGIPRCVMEAMAAGVPVIASKIQGCRDLIEDGQSGLLCEVDDTEGFTSTIEHVLKDSNFRKELADSARDRVNRFFSAQTMATAYSNLYSDLVDGVRSAAYD